MFRSLDRGPDSQRTDQNAVSSSRGDYETKEARGGGKARIYLAAFTGSGRKLAAFLLHIGPGVGGI